jgi:hypothetical protein
MRNTFMADEDSFIEHLYLTQDRTWLEKYFDLIAEIIDISKLSSGDPRLVTSVVRNNAYLPVTINNRYVLVASKNSDEINIICQKQLGSRKDLHSGVIFEFRQLPGERKYNDIPPIMVEIDENLVILEELRVSPYGWKQTILTETDRAKGSPYKKYHNPFVFKAATDKEYRNAIFSLVFKKP